LNLVDQVIELCCGSVLPLGVKEHQRRTKVLKSLSHGDMLHHVDHIT